MNAIEAMVANAVLGSLGNAFIVSIVLFMFILVLGFALGLSIEGVAVGAIPWSLIIFSMDTATLPLKVGVGLVAGVIIGIALIKVSRH